MITSVAGRKASFAEKILPPFLGVSAIRDQKGPGVSREGENLLISTAAACRPFISGFSLGDQLAQQIAAILRDRHHTAFVALVSGAGAGYTEMRRMCGGQATWTEPTTGP
jgi:hypothetical protein